MPTNFRITVIYDNKEYEVNVTRISPGIHPNNYFATIVTAEDVMNKYPMVTYTTVDGDIVYDDKLEKIFPGFAEIQKKEIINYLDLNNIEL